MLKASQLNRSACDFGKTPGFADSGIDPEEPRTTDHIAIARFARVREPKRCESDINVFEYVWISRRIELIRLRNASNGGAAGKTENIRILQCDGLIVQIAVVRVIHSLRRGYGRE